jgi:aerobic carbon-monoxide dehydrogenase medium subunit
VKPAAFEYHAPETIDDVVGLLAEHGDEAKPLAGGQSLVPMLALRLARFEHVIDLNGVPALAGIERRNGTVAVGAMTRQAELERSDDAAAVPLLGLAAPLIGHFQIRNRGTVGGSIAHADPAGELPTVALALDAELDVASTAGTRTVAASELFAGTWETTLAPEELLTRVRFPVWRGRCGFAVDEVARRYGDFALAGLGSMPSRAGAAEAAIVGHAPSADELSEIGRLAMADLEPPTDIHASGEYRRAVGAHVVTRGLGTALERATR